MYQGLCGCRTTGLSADFIYLNPIGFLALTLWSFAVRFSPTARKQYADRHGGHAPQVSDADLAFALHALVITLLIVAQVLYYARRRAVATPYDRFASAEGTAGADERTPLFPEPADWHRAQRQRQLEEEDAGPDVSQPSVLAQIGIVMIFITAAGQGLSVWIGRTQWLDFLYFASSVKLAISAVKYIPQVLLNRRLKSADGFAIGQIITVSRQSRASGARGPRS